jgi:D-alanyl-lipoteichoic acid acyltransferase DltB (MBOAT superfamily)
VYKKKLEPTEDLVAFSAFVCFFPQLVAGPIERATNLLPQFYKKRTFEYDKAVDGMRQILWGLFKKVVIADNCAEYANLIFNNYQDYNGSTLLLGAIFFTFQIYGDFSGYSDIAIGTSRLFGFNLMQNFATPYFSRDIAEFWRRWHISLSTWFRDYLYIPLGGSRGGTWMKVRNTFIIFLVSGFWHGANWTFIVWGGLNALYFLPLLLLKRNRTNLGVVAEGRMLPSLRELWQMGTTFLLTVFAWVFFRAENILRAKSYLAEVFSRSVFSIPEVRPRYLCIFLLLFLTIEWRFRYNQHPFKVIPKNIVYRYSLYAILFLLILFVSTPKQEFIYFQF